MPILPSTPAPYKIPLNPALSLLSVPVAWPPLSSQDGHLSSSYQDYFLIVALGIFSPTHLQALTLTYRTLMLAPTSYSPAVSAILKPFLLEYKSNFSFFIPSLLSYFSFPFSFFFITFPLFSSLIFIPS